MGGESKILYTSIPKISDLAYYIALIDPKEPRDPSAPSEFQWQTLKSRFVYIFLFLSWCPVHYESSVTDFLFGKTRMY